MLMDDPQDPQEDDAMFSSHFGYDVFLSFRNADTRRCLEELAMVVERRKLLLPLFYDVSPSQVRRQGGPFELGFREHEARYGAEKVRRWRIATEKAGGISGWDSKS